MSKPQLFSLSGTYRHKLSARLSITYASGDFSTNGDPSVLISLHVGERFVLYSPLERGPMTAHLCPVVLFPSDDRIVAFGSVSSLATVQFCWVTVGAAELALTRRPVAASINERVSMYVGAPMMVSATVELGEPITTYASGVTCDPIVWGTLFPSTSGRSNPFSAFSGSETAEVAVSKPLRRSQAYITQLQWNVHAEGDAYGVGEWETLRTRVGVWTTCEDAPTRVLLRDVYEGDDGTEVDRSLVTLCVGRDGQVNEVCDGSASGPSLLQPGSELKNTILNGPFASNLALRSVPLHEHHGDLLIDLSLDDEEIAVSED